MALYDEIHSQPDIVRQSFAQNITAVHDIARALQEQHILYAFVAARGTSDNAARYAKYLWGAHNQLPVALATPSLFSMYERPPRLAGALVIGISQSGQSPDIVDVVAEGRRQGRPTLAITNEPASPLAETADYVIAIHAGEEKAVAATKTYTSQLLAIAMLSAAMAGSAGQMQLLERLPDWLTEVLQQAEPIARQALRYRYMEQCVVVGRGFNYATAFEWSLKLKELTYVVAEPYSSADLRHGPIAVIEQGFPVMAIAPTGAVHADVHGLLKELSQERQAELLVISDEPQTLALATAPIPLPAGIPEWLTPLVTIVPGQLFSYHLTIVKGFDTESPRGLRKVTKTT